MSLIGFLLLGLIVGAIAKFLVPESHGGGIFLTMLLGVVGAMVGGWLGMIIFGVDLEEFWSIQTWALAIAGSVLVLFIYGLIVGRSGTRS